MRRIALILLFLVVFLVTLVLRTPIDRVQAWLPDTPLASEQLSGTLARGSAFNLPTAAGPIDADWVLRPASLLRGRVGADVEFLWDQNIEGEAQVALGLGREVQLRDVLVAGEARQFDNLVLPGILQFDGSVRVALEQLTVAQGQYGPAVGEVTWSGASVTGQIPVALGDIKLDLAEEGGGTRADISNSGGDVALSGTITLSNDGAYVTDIVAVPSPSANPGVVFTLQNIALAESGNRFRIRESGNLNDML